jgi:hypothetical protein
MRITYAITVCNEFIEIQRLVHFLLQHKRIQDNIVILYDEANGDPAIEQFLKSHSINSEFSWHKAPFNKHFADWKNKLNSFCNGDYIFQIDADEMPNELLIENLPEILVANSNVDAISVPRWNTVDGLTKEFVEKYNWKVDQYERVNWPDYQWRIYKNNQSIRWVNKVHEVLNGFNSYATLPAEESLSLYHPKTIERQRTQNEYYDTL